MHVVREYIERYLILWLCLSSGAALAWALSSQEALAYFKLASNWTKTPSIVAAMFGIGFLLPPEELKQVLKNWPQVLFGTTTQYLSMPLLAFLIASAFQIQGAHFAGIILVGCVPGAMASNLLTMTSRGNVSYSICLTTTATMLSPVLVPLGLLMFLGVQKGPDPLGVFQNLALTVALPIVVGFAVKMFLFRDNRTAQAIMGIVANLAILWIIAFAIGLNAERLRQFEMIVLVALLLINLLGYAAGVLASRLIKLDSAKMKALTLEIGMQNAGVGTVLALGFFKDPTTAIAPAIYTFGCMFTGTILANFWRWREARNSTAGNSAGSA